MRLKLFLTTALFSCLALQPGFTVPKCYPPELPNHPDGYVFDYEPSDPANNPDSRNPDNSDPANPECPYEADDYTANPDHPSGYNGLPRFPEQGGGNPQPEPEQPPSEGNSSTVPGR
ncbi:MAG TPA: hypothetical protein PKO06_17495, partial [Candidatus Ozemobacteraceae bacterium]|nr:hypothetical protein [Candidatus Ozemobacteraceae bacterium]